MWQNIIKNKSFTLLELLVSMAILGVIVAAIYTSFRGGTDSWTAARARTERFSNARAVMDQFTREVTAALVNTWSGTYRVDMIGNNYDNGTVSDLKDDYDEILFMAPLPPTPSQTGSDFSEVGYRRDTTAPDANIVERFRSNDPDFVQSFGATTYLAQGIMGFNLEYWDSSTSTWQNTWDSAVGGPEAGTLPKAIRLTINVQDEEQRASAQTFSTIIYLRNN